MESQKDAKVERFSCDFKELEDGTGFRIEGCDYVFRYDSHDGWFDENGTYYNKNGQPTPAPEGSKQRETQKSGSEESKAGDKQPNPDRFKNFALFEDKKAFAVEDSNNVFYFDQDGGWFDEHNNYYDHEGKPTTPPKPDDENEDDDYYDEEEDYNPEVDKLMHEYDLYDDEDYDVPDNRIQKHGLDAEYENLENKTKVETYPDDELIHIQISNISFKGKMDEFKKKVKDTGAEIENFDYERYGRDSHTGYADVSVKNKKSALSVMTLNGEEFAGRRVVVTLREFAKVDSDEDEDEEEDFQPADNKEHTSAFEDTDFVQILFSNINYKISMDEFKIYLETKKNIKVDDHKFKKYGENSHRGEVAITVKGKKLVDEALKLNETYFEGRKLYVNVIGKIQPRLEESKISEKPAQDTATKEPQKTQPSKTEKNDSFFS